MYVNRNFRSYWEQISSRNCSYLVQFSDASVKKKNMAKKISHTLGWLLIKCRIKKLWYYRMTADFVCSANFPNFLPNEISYTCLLIRCNPNKKPHACPKKQQIFQGKIVFYNNWKANTNYIDTFLTLCNIFFYGQPLSAFIFC